MRRAAFACVRHGIEDRPIPPARSALRPRRRGLRRGADPPHPALAGGGVEIKGAQTVLDALSALTEALDGLQLIVAGGEGDDAILRQPRQHACRAGPRPSAFQQMRALYAAADLVLLPSVVPESFSMVVYEAFQAGAPAVGAAIGAVPELIAHDMRGYLFPPGDAGALAAQAAAHFAKPAYERRRMRHACREFIVSQLSLANHVTALQRVYQEVLA